MSGERDLSTLLRDMTPLLSATEYVYCCFSDFRLPAGLDPLCQFREKEGLTVIVEKSAAEQFGIPYTFEARMISLMVYSDLEAVGFLAQILTILAAAGISCNPVSAYYHDHLFIPAQRADEAMRLLCALSESTECRRAD